MVCYFFTKAKPPKTKKACIKGALPVAQRWVGRIRPRDFEALLERFRHADPSPGVGRDVDPESSHTHKHKQVNKTSAPPSRYIEGGVMPSRRGRAKRIEASILQYQEQFQCTKKATAVDTYSRVTVLPLPLFSSRKRYGRLNSACRTVRARRRELALSCDQTNCKKPRQIENVPGEYSEATSTIMYTREEYFGHRIVTEKKGKPQVLGTLFYNRPAR